MRFSEAMRLGAMNRPQAFHYLCDPAGGTCALGAAADAIGILDHDTSGYTGLAPKEWKPTAQHRTHCPCGCDLFLQVQKLCIHLNNDERWTREAIADWIETIEKNTESGTNVVAACPQVEPHTHPVRA